MDQDKPNAKSVTRRELLKILTATGSAVATSHLLPNEWTPPIIESGVLPAHAQGSPTPTPTPIVPAPPLGEKFAVMGTTSDGEKVIVFPDAGDLPTPPQNIVPGLPNDAQPHGVAYFGQTGGLVSDFRRSRVHIIDLKNSNLTGTISTSAAGYDGTGTIAVSPGSAYALASGNSNQVVVVKAPFTSSSTVTSVNLPDHLKTYQTQGIVFDLNRRAYVYHRSGISILDEPYTSISFTIPAAFNSLSGAIAITPNGDTILTTDLNSGNVYIFKAPFSQTSTPEVLTIVSTTEQTSLPDKPQVSEPASNGTTPPINRLNEKEGRAALLLDGISTTPDGKTALVCDSNLPKVFAMSSPFSSSATIEEIPIPLSSLIGFEDIGMSFDGSLAIVTGNSNGNHQPAVFIEAPFTAAGAKVYLIDIDNGNGRGAGAVRFQPLST